MRMMVEIPPNRFETLADLALASRRDVRRQAGLLLDIALARADKARRGGVVQGDGRAPESDQ